MKKIKYYSMRLSDIYYTTKNYFKNLIYILRKGNLSSYYAFDYSYTLNNIRISLERQRDVIKNATYFETSEYYVNRINLCLKLLDLGYFETYEDLCYEKLSKEYGSLYDLEMVSEPHEDNNDLFKLEFVRGIDKLEDLELKNKYQTIFDKEEEKAKQKTLKAKRLFWQVLHKDLENFWC